MYRIPNGYIAAVSCLIVLLFLLDFCLHLREHHAIFDKNAYKFSLYRWVRDAVFVQYGNYIIQH